MMKTLKIIFILFLLFEIIFSFPRHETIPMDGDMGSMVYGYNEVKSDPLGIKVLVKNEQYGGTNRFFAIWTAAIYFKNAPLLFQAVCSPVKSIYVSGAFIKTFTQFFLIYILSIFITGRKSLWNFDLLLAAVLIAPLFQTYGFHYFMGVIDYSVTYTIFYAFAINFVALFFLPFFNAAFERRSFHFSPWMIVLLCILAFFITFNGPLNAPVVLLICAGTLVYLFIRNLQRIEVDRVEQRIMLSIKAIPSHLAILFTVCIIFAMYSMYIGTNNSENFWDFIPLSERYEKLWNGLFRYYTNRLGPPVLIGMIILNKFIIAKHNHTRQSQLILQSLNWLLVLVLLYIFLLPLGGYRNYRPHIIRNDTLVPVTVALILFYGLTTYHIMTRLNFRFKILYYLLIGAVMFVYINADTEFQAHNKCENEALTKLAESKEKFIYIDNDCSILNWNKTLTYSNSKGTADLLLYWNVTNEKKVFYQK